ncbi:hypothetical protein GCM10010988_23350 [Cnuibacter physcomitrellae]|uniref:Uncharacterized protein n=1 Tax=Cnuibacter physcomitrellae TaxID=1619308 RepID=A0A1X9LPE8_9MICO|nr:hypothetical protein B5808_18475 [Cnuibacter physcomitrellae]GGI39294.1 hypothetical protein GCM10010988_23350 [Cnuibacter physcomitrellae]
MNGRGQTNPSSIGLAALVFDAPPFVACALAVLPGGGPPAAALGVVAMLLTPVSLAVSAVLTVWALTVAVRRRWVHRSSDSDLVKEVGLPLLAALTGAGGAVALWMILSTAS